MAFVDELRRLRDDLRDRMDSCDSDTAYASLARQYRETIKELSEVEEPEDTGIESLLDGCDAVR